MKTWGWIMAAVWGVIAAVVVAFAARVAGVDFTVAAMIGAAAGLLVLAYQIVRRGL